MVAASNDLKVKSILFHKTNIMAVKIWGNTSFLHQLRFLILLLVLIAQIAHSQQQQQQPFPPFSSGGAGVGGGTNVPWVSPEQCAKNGQVFDPIGLQCLQCPPLIGNISSLRPLPSGCQCPLGSVISTNDGQLLNCQPCAKGLATSQSKDFCVRCLGPDGTTLEPIQGKCPKCSSGILQLVDGLNGSNESPAVGTQKCVKCPSGTGPDPAGQKCVPCATNLDCFCTSMDNSSSICSAPDQSPSTIPLLDTSQQQQFEAQSLAQRLRQAAHKCRLGLGQSCQQLANFCVLQNYAREQPSRGRAAMDTGGLGACDLLEQARTSTSTNAANPLVPQLLYANIEAQMEIFREGAIDAQFQLDEHRSNGRLDILAMAFAQDGQFLGQWAVGKRPDILQMCPPMGQTASSSQLDGAYRFGRFYAQKCRLPLGQLLRQNLPCWSQQKKSGTTDNDSSNVDECAGGNTIFFELHLRYEDSQGRSMLHQIPVLNENVLGDQYTGFFPNRFDGPVRRDSRLLLTKRFFMLDAQWGRTAAPMEGGEQNEGANEEKRRELLVRVANKIQLHIHFQSSQDGHIFVPYLQIGYNQHIVQQQLPSSNLTDSAEGVFEEALQQMLVDTEFAVQYHVESGTYDKAVEVLMATCCSLAAVWAALQAYSWGRRSGRLMIDGWTILQLLLHGADSIGNVFLALMGAACCWLTFAYKLQSQLRYVPLSGVQENSFFAYMLSALALKAVALAHTIAGLCLVQTFFIDWERPRLFPPIANFDGWSTAVVVEPKKVGDAEEDGQKKEKRGSANSVVIWRTYLIANEWNELQLFRKTHIGLQLLALLFLLDYLQFGQWAELQPGFDRYNVPAEVVETRMSRFAVDLSFYLGLGLAQWLVQVVVIERLADPFRNFMDLCSVANISVLALTNPLRGFYIHGRSVHGFSDTDMLQMNTFLQRERENLCALRGLENGSDLQTFVCNLPRALRDRIDQILTGIQIPTGAVAAALNLRTAAVPLPAIGQGGGAFERASLRMEQQARVYGQLNDLLKDFVNRVDTAQLGDYQICDARFVEQLLGLDLADTSRTGTFKRDRSEMAYSSVFLYGQEWALLSVELLLFCVLDMLWPSRLLAAFCTYLCSKLTAHLTNHFFTRQLARTSLVDSRFLI